MAVTEVLDGGPWTAGGHATVLGLATDGRPYLGKSGQFSSLKCSWRVSSGDQSEYPRQDSNLRPPV